MTAQFNRMTPQTVRMWHHQRSQVSAKKAESYRGKTDNHSQSLMKQHLGRADFHMACVRALNAVCTSTVEQDWAKATDYDRNRSSTR